ncbi:DUF2568 domain-containing protein [Streptomyces sp. NPDC050982]|uniref:DUF2568 domain-containing protein n=1 Tax=Streptomyces sp. NPDC050982 TaxID=3154746 RepID=UPI0033CBB023
MVVAQVVPDVHARRACRRRTGGRRRGSWRKVPSPWRRLPAVALPVAAGWAWGSFAVPDDPSRSGESDIHTPGPVRLLLELTVFFGAVAALNFAGLRRAARRLLVIMVGYQVLAYDRIGWLIRLRYVRAVGRMCVGGAIPPTEPHPTSTSSSAPGRQTG